MIKLLKKLFGKKSYYQRLLTWMVSKNYQTGKSVIKYDKKHKCEFILYEPEKYKVMLICRDVNSSAWSHGHNCQDAYEKMLDVKGAMNESKKVIDFEIIEIHLYEYYEVVRSFKNISISFRKGWFGSYKAQALDFIISPVGRGRTPREAYEKLVKKLQKAGLM